MMNYLLLILTILLMLSACKENEKEHITRLVKEWQGKEICFPKNMVFTRFTTDTVDCRIPKSEYKVVVYVDSVGCISCKLQLSKWKELIAYVDSVTDYSVPFLFIFQSKDDRELCYMLKRDNFELPICIDHNNIFNEQNHFPSEPAFQTFLLDYNNIVTVIGNPIHNLQVKELYLEQLTKKANPTTCLLKTTAEVVNPEIDFGIFPKSENKLVAVEIQNTGDNPLFIVNVSTTCGCTALTYSRTPVKPDDILRVGVMIKPKNTGYFNETVTIKCNTNRPVKVKIRGNVQ